MSKSKSPTKVLRVAFNRIQKGWVQNLWSFRNKQTGVTQVCIEGAVYGYVNSFENKNPACKMACDIILQVIQEKHGKGFQSIPQFNDNENTTLPMVEDVVKTALIRAETGGLLRGTEEECWG